MRMKVLGVVTLTLLSAACGSSREERIAAGGPDLGTALPKASGSDGLADANDQLIDPVIRIRMAQSELKREGLYGGAVDGIAGPATSQGIAKFQQHERLQQTARLDRETRDRMILNAMRMNGVSSARSQSDSDTAGSGSSCASKC